ncbi:MAG: SDR family NAD(P)-dependent oxidoreductase, partial [Spirochaetales bacterium]|nr:SDR family NAD(P)-dependent oxidoreductase [Spirochaetales bacterium]
MEFYRNKRVWITGASSGLGRELASLLVSFGARVILTARSTRVLKELAASAAAERGTEEAVRVLPGDMEKLDSLKELTGEAWKTFDGLDMVILNAGVSHRSLFIDTTPEIRERVLKVNLLAQMEILGVLLPLMVSRQCGHIVSVTSLAGKVSSPWRSCYAAAKHGLHGLL